MLGDVTIYENVPYRKIMVLSKFGACFTIIRLLLHCLFHGNYAMLNWERNILFGFGNGAEFRPQNRVIESPVTQQRGC